MVISTKPVPSLGKVCEGLMPFTKEDEIMIKTAVQQGIREYFEEMERHQGFSAADHTRNTIFTLGLEQNAKILKKAGICGTVTLFFTVLGILYAALAGKL